MTETRSMIYHITFGVLLGIMLVVASMFIESQFAEDPPEGFPYSFELEKIHQYERDCRYNVYSLSTDERVRVGYIRHHCNYRPGNYNLFIDN